MLKFLRALFGSRKRAATSTASAAVIAATAFIAPWEGLRTDAYQDIVGVWTVCYGETNGVRPGDSYTETECRNKLGARVEEFHSGLTRCVPSLPSMPVGVQVAFTSWAYNVGLGNACSSTLARKANAGDLSGACNELPRWKRAGGKVVRGLENRRGAERALCLKALE